MTMGDDKKNWRDIDRQRDKSRHTNKRSGRGGSSRSSSKSYKKDLDKLFDSGGQVPQRFKEMMDTLAPEEGSEEALWREAVQELRETEGFREFAMAVRKFRRAGHDLPDDEDLLIRMLDLPDERTVQAVLEHVLDMERRRGFNRTAPLKNRITTIRSIAEDPRTGELLDQIADIV
jgi:hypothetical protein